MYRRNFSLEGILLKAIRSMYKYVCNVETLVFTLPKSTNNKLLLALVCALCVATTDARVCVWTGGGTPASALGGDLLWTDPGNWKDGAVPQDGDTVSFDEKNTTKHRLNKNLTLENFFYTNSLGTVFNGKSDQILTLTGSKSEIVVTYSKGMSWYAPIHLDDEAKLKISGSVAFKNPCDISGSGEIEKVGTGNLDFYRQNSFTGTWYLRNGKIRVYGATCENPLGSSDAVAHIYGKNETTGANATFAVYATASYDNRFFLHDAGVSTYRTATFNGDMTFVSEQKNSAAFILDGAYDADYYIASSPPGFIINGDIFCDDSAYTCRVMPRASYGATDFFIEFNGALNLGTKSLDLTTRTYDTDRGALYINSPISTTSSIGLSIYGNQTKFYCGAENVLGGKDLSFGVSEHSSNVMLDLCGHDQTVRKLMFVQDVGYTTSGSITSSGGPATLFVTRVNNASEHHNVVALDGEVSLSLKKDNTSKDYYPFVFTGGTTTGWILSDYNSCDLTAAAFPNLGGIALEGAGIVHVGATTALKGGVKFEFRSLTTGHLKVDSGVSISAERVLVDVVDVPPGTYCRPGAGIVGATEVAWLGGENCNGTVTVAEHDPVFIWTGNGADGSLSTGANWGGGVAPDLSSAAATIDFRYASSDKPVVLSGRVTPACTIVDATAFEKGVLTFSGDGALVLSGDGVVTNSYIFTDHTSLVWNGPGTLVLMGASSTSGTVSVAAGKVVVAAGKWQGGASVAANAELEVMSDCGSGVFGEDDVGLNCAVLSLDGRLTLGDGIVASVKRMQLGGASAYGTYGSSSSDAKRKDDVHFGGFGIVSILSVPGMSIIVR